EPPPGGPARRARPLSGLDLPPGDLQPIVDRLNAGHPLDDLLDQPLRLPTLDAAGEGHLTVLHGHLDFARVDVGVLVELLVDLVPDHLVGPVIEGDLAMPLAWLRVGLLLGWHRRSHPLLMA